METAQERINRLQQEIESEKRKQEHCRHDFNKAVFDPKKEIEFVPDIAGGLKGHGSDPYYDSIPKDKWVDRWSRTCKICGKVEYTYKQKVTHVDKEADFS